MLQPWFSNAKLGIFIHWGIYAVNGIAESWSFWRNEISHEDYMKQCAGFTASRWDPDAWVDLFKRAGARYAVLTAKHHDGVALFDTKQSDLSVVKKTPAGRDLVAPYCQAVRRGGLKVGLYFSQLDWSHPDYATVPNAAQGPGALNPYTYRGTTDLAAWNRFIQFHRAQLDELCTNYGPIDLLWFDGDWERTTEQWNMPELRERLHRMQPNVILNSRMKGYGDYDTPEQGVPIYAPPRAWELCVTLNDSWGYQPRDTHYKTPRQIVRIFCDCLSMGGNMLLDVGPMPDGTIPPEQVQRLEELGKWIADHKEAVYETTAGLPPGYTLSGSSLSTDRKTVYLYLYDRSWDDIAVQGIKNKIKNITLLKTGQPLKHQKIGGADWIGHPGTLWINIPEDQLNPLATVVKIELEGELDLYGVSK